MRLPATRLTMCAWRAIAAGFIACVATTVVYGSDGPDPVREFDIAAQPLESALLALASECEWQLAMSSRAVEQARSAGVKGRLACDGALARILDGSPFTSVMLGASTVAIRRRDAIERDRRVARRVENERPQADLLNETITVTGSRIRARSSDGAIPIISVSGEHLRATGQISLADALVDLPAIDPGVSPRNSQAQTSGGAGLNLLDLRGMGVERTLVLVDGRRQVSSRRGLAAVDINAIPAAFVERVEIATGGNSAVHGADAVTGVVNIVLKDRYDGIGADVSGGQAVRGDAEWHSVQLFGGHALTNAPLNVMASLVVDRAAGVSAQARSYAYRGLDLVANSGTDPAYVHASDVRPSHYAPQGSFDIAGRRYVFLDDGSGMRPFDFGASGELGGSHIGGDGPYLDDYVSLRMPMERTAGFARLEYEFGEAATLALQARATESEVTAYWQPLADPLTEGSLFLRIDNPYLPSTTVDAMRAANLETLELWRIHADQGRVGSANRRLLQQYTAELTGGLARQWTYELFATYGLHRDRAVSLNLRDPTRFLESLDAVRDAGTGETVCRDPAARARGCMPLSLVGAARFDAGALEYSRVNPVAREQMSSTLLGGHVGGPLHAFAHRVDSVFGWEYREETSERRSSVEQELGSVALPRVPSDRGRFDTLEAYTELATRIVDDTALSESVDLGAAVRVARHSTVGSQVAWQASLDYSVIPGVSVRVVRSRAIRAPNIRELFSSGEEGFVSIADPCDRMLRNRSEIRAARCAELDLPSDFDGQNRVLRPVLYVGNPELDSEIANSWTAGLMLAPEAWPDLRFSADYWRIGIEDAIETLDEQMIVNRCVDLPALQADEFCSSITRTAGGSIAEIRAVERNGGRLRAEGVDVSASYGTLRSSGPWLELLATSLLRFDVTDAGAPQGRSLAGVLPHVRFQGSLHAGYRVGSIAFGWKMNVLSSAWIAADARGNIDRPRTGTRSFHDAYASYVLDSIRVRLGVSNVFDAAPPARAFGVNQGVGDGAIYPNLGRQVFGAIEVAF